MSGPSFTNDRTRSHVWDAPSAGPRVLVMWEGGCATRSLVAHGTVVVGRGDECDLQVLHASVSRRHVAIEAGPPLAARDLGSSNGTRIAGRALAKGASCTITFGQPIEVGAAVVIVQGGPSDPLAPRVDAPTEASGMARLRQLTKLVAPTGMPVLLLGETGVGKEVTASAIHAASPRVRGPFVRINCAALTESLLESELFGHERGAFTGAHAAKVGLVEAANGGTMFLDEIGELPLTLQAKLLRVLEDGEVRRVGATRGSPVDVRFIAATNRDLPADVSRGAFRSDLYFRLNGISLHIPPLRDRKDELAGLAATLLEEGYRRARVAPKPLSAPTLAALTAYTWPGNVRELRNVLERAVVLAAGGDVRPEHLIFEARIFGGTGALASLPTISSPPPASPTLPQPEPQREASREQLPIEVERLERERIERALSETKGNQTLAARILGLTRRQLIGRMDAYGLPRPRKKES